VGSAHDDLGAVISTLTRIHCTLEVVNLDFLRLLWAEWREAQGKIAKVEEMAQQTKEER